MKIKKNKYHFLFIVFIFIMLLIVSSVNAIIEYNQTLNETINYFEKFPTTSMGVIDNKGIIVADKERWLIGYDTTESYPESIMYLKEDFYEKKNTTKRENFWGIFLTEFQMKKWLNS